MKGEKDIPLHARDDDLKGALRVVLEILDINVSPWGPDIRWTSLVDCQRSEGSVANPSQSTCT